MVRLGSRLQLEPFSVTHSNLVIVIASVIVNVVIIIISIIIISVPEMEKCQEGCLGCLGGSVPCDLCQL